MDHRFSLRLIEASILQLAYRKIFSANCEVISALNHSNERAQYALEKMNKAEEFAV